MVVDKVVAADGSVGLVEIPSVVAFYDEYSAAAASVTGLYNEVGNVLDHLRKALHLELAVYAAHKFGGRHAVFHRELFGAQLVVNVRIVPAVVVAHYVGVVAPVHAEHSAFKKLFRRDEFWKL